MPRKRIRRYDDALASVSRIFAAVSTILTAPDPAGPVRKDGHDREVADLARLLLRAEPPGEVEVTEFWQRWFGDGQPMRERLARDLTIGLRAVHAQVGPGAAQAGRPLALVRVIPSLLAACPSLLPAWAAEADHNVHGDERLDHLDASTFLRHLVDLHRRGDADALRAAFRAIERLVADDDEQVRTLVVIGYIEGLQMATVTDAGVDPETAFRPLAGPVSQRWWVRIDRFWAGDVAALRVDDP